jgi:hypothetical protein
MTPDPQALSGALESQIQKNEKNFVSLCFLIVFVIQGPFRCLAGHKPLFSWHLIPQALSGALESQIQKNEKNFVSLCFLIVFVIQGPFRCLAGHKPLFSWHLIPQALSGALESQTKNVKKQNFFWFLFFFDCVCDSSTIQVSCVGHKPLILMVPTLTPRSLKHPQELLNHKHNQKKRKKKFKKNFLIHAPRRAAWHHRRFASWCWAPQRGA